MTIVILTIIIIGYFLLATEKYTNINKAAVAIFVGTVGWILYVCHGTGYVMEHHANEYLSFLNGGEPSSINVKNFISQYVFLKYVGKASEIALFLLATMTIVDILQNNGCFDFIGQILRTRKSQKMLWIVSIVTFLLSANLDNLTTTVMMLTIMHSVVIRQRQRILLGCAIVISANCGGALTVIGSPTGLVLWNSSIVTATKFSLSMAFPCLIAWIFPIFCIGRKLPEYIEIENVKLPYRGDDTNLNVWQRILMLFVGIGGLWFIPTFHNITKLSPFVGALCVVSVLWIVNEIVNRKLMNTDQMIQRRIPKVLQYGVIQMILFVIGMMLTLGVVCETGLASKITHLVTNEMHINFLSLGFITEILSMVLDNFASTITMLSISTNQHYCHMIAYASAVGGNILCIGSMSGLALMKMERIRLGWYTRNIGWIAFISSSIGLISMDIIYKLVQQ